MLWSWSGLYNSIKLICLHYWQKYGLYFYFFRSNILHIIYYTGDQSCYCYGSLPNNESNCVTEGRQLTLNFIVYNPHDNFTNMTIRWFRNGHITRKTSSNEEIMDIQSEYMLSQEYASNPSTDIGNSINCSAGPLYRDMYTLIIHNFTFDKNGYYWCQIYVDNSFSQPSEYAWFYASDNSTCKRNFVVDIKPNCVDFNQEHATTPQETSTPETMVIASTSVILETTSTSATSEATSTSDLEVTSTEAESSMDYLLYIIGFLVVLILLAISLFTLILLCLYCKGRKKDCQNGKYAITTILLVTLN